MTSRRYALEFAPRAIRPVGKLDRQIATRIRAAAEALRDDPRPAGARMLTGMHGVWRIRVAKDYRMVYTLDDDRLVIPCRGCGPPPRDLSLTLAGAR